MTLDIYNQNHKANHQGAQIILWVQSLWNYTVKTEKVREINWNELVKVHAITNAKNNRTTIRFNSKLLLGKGMIMKRSAIPSVTPHSPKLLRAGSVRFARLSSMMYQYSVPMASAKQLKLRTPVKPPLTTTKPNVIFISDRICAIPTQDKPKTKLKTIPFAKSISCATWSDAELKGPTSWWNKSHARSPDSWNKWCWLSIQHVDKTSWHSRGY